MSSIEETHGQTAQVLADAVTEVSRQAIEPILEPFATQLKKATRSLLEKVDHVQDSLNQSEDRYDQALQAVRTLESSVDGLNQRLDGLSVVVAAATYEGVQRAGSDVRTALNDQGDQLAIMRKEMALLNEMQHQNQSGTKSLRGQIDRNKQLTIAVIVSVWFTFITIVIAVLALGSPT